MNYAINLLKNMLCFKQTELKLLENRRYVNDHKIKLKQEIEDLKRAISIIKD